MKEILISLLFVGILRGMESLMEYNRQSGHAKIVSIVEYRNRRRLHPLIQNG